MTGSGGLLPFAEAAKYHDMDDHSALRLALVAARAFLAVERSPLETARVMTGIVNPWRFWWVDMGGADGPLSTFYSADDEGMKLPWLGNELGLWPDDLREAKRIEAEAAETKWWQPIYEACDALIEYAANRSVS